MTVITVLTITFLLFIFRFKLLGILAFIDNKINERKTEQDVLKFIADHPDRASMYVIETGLVVVDYQSDVKMPLASVCKIVVAVEFAEQVSQKKINPAERIPLQVISRFFILGTDGNAHPAWLKEMEKKNAINDDGIPLIEIAKGMIQFSSNANMEVLIDKLGIGAINRRIEQLRLEQHDPLYPVSSAILMSAYLKKIENRSLRQVIAMMKAFSYEQYALKATQIFELICQDVQWVHKLRPPQMSMAVQRIWSDKMPRSTTKHYAKLLQSIQNGELLSDEANRIMKEMMDDKWALQSKFEKVGCKGGSSITILNQTLYGVDKSGDQIQLAIFTYDPKGFAAIWLEKKLPLFLHQYLNDISFKNQVNKTLRKEVTSTNGTDFSY